MAENQNHIARTTPCEKGTVAAICSKDDGVYFIAPQDAIAVAYHRWLADHRIFWISSGTGLDLLRALCDAGVACKREVKNNKVQAWRFGFYKGESKIACLAFPIDNPADVLVQISKIAPETVSDKSPDAQWTSEDTSDSRNA